MSVRLVPAAVLLLYVLAYDTRASRTARLRFLFPVLFALIFLAFYLPHSLAANRVPRYVLPLWTLVLGGAFAATSSVAEVGGRESDRVAARQRVNVTASKSRQSTS